MLFYLLLFIHLFIYFWFFYLLNVFFFFFFFWTDPAEVPSTLSHVKIQFLHSHICIVLSSSWLSSYHPRIFISFNFILFKVPTKDFVQLLLPISCLFLFNPAAFLGGNPRYDNPVSHILFVHLRDEQCNKCGFIPILFKVFDVNFICLYSSGDRTDLLW